MMLLSLWTHRTPFETIIRSAPRDPDGRSQMKKLMQSPELLTRIVPADCPSAWRALIARCCDIDPKRRFATFEELATGLKAFAAAVTLEADEELLYDQLMRGL